MNYIFSQWIFDKAQETINNLIHEFVPFKQVDRFGYETVEKVQPSDDRILYEQAFTDL